MQAQVKTWGNSQGIRLPKEVLQEARILVDDSVKETRVSMKKILKSMLALCLALVMMVEMVSPAEAGEVSQRKIVNVKYNKLYSLWNNDDDDDGNVQRWYF